MLSGLKLVRLNSVMDERGFFKEFYRKAEWQGLGIEYEFVQDNLSFSKNKVIRGMHFQNKGGQAKLVSVLKGKIFDVAVDMRPDSPSFGCWEGVYLEENEQFFIPGGYAHGFCVMSEEGAYVHYKVSTYYDPDEERGFRFDDPFINIAWPVKDPLLSKRDQEAPDFSIYTGVG